ncbi:cell division protein FtsX [Pacificimonas sp. ICDLI1SI03]
MIPDWIRPRAERFRFLPAEQAARGSLPWIVALMVALAVLGMAAGISLVSGVGVMKDGLAQRFTVQIVEPNPDIRADKVAATVAALEGRDGISRIRVLETAELRKLLEPWLGSGNVGEDLPLPAMIDAEAESPALLNQVAASLERDVDGARVDDHAGWLAPVARLAWVLAIVALAAALLLTAAMAAIIVLGVRAGLTRHAETVDVLHLIGAEDRVITQLFQYRFGMVAALGAVTGFLVALLLIFAIGRLITALGSGLVAAAGLPWWGWVMVVMVPVVAVMLSTITARITVERSLADVL